MKKMVVALVVLGSLITQRVESQLTIDPNSAVAMVDYQESFLSSESITRVDERTWSFLSDGIHAEEVGPKVKSLSVNAKARVSKYKFKLDHLDLFHGAMTLRTYNILALNKTDVSVNGSTKGSKNYWSDYGKQDKIIRNIDFNTPHKYVRVNNAALSLQLRNEGLNKAIHNIKSLDRYTQSHLRLTSNVKF